MDDRLLGELLEFKRASLERLDRVETKVDNLVSFKWKVLGGAAALMAAIELGHLVLSLKGG